MAVDARRAGSAAIAIAASVGANAARCWGVRILRAAVGGLGRLGPQRFALVSAARLLSLLSRIAPSSDRGDEQRQQQAAKQKRPNRCHWRGLWDVSGPARSHRSIRLEVSGNKVYMDDLKVIYANGEPDDIPVRSEIRAGGQTRALDLRGERRVLKQVEMKDRSQPNFKGQATVCVDAQS
jgi:hypothetical protein